MDAGAAHRSFCVGLKLRNAAARRLYQVVVFDAAIEIDAGVAKAVIADVAVEYEADAIEPAPIVRSTANIECGPCRAVCDTGVFFVLHNATSPSYAGV